MDKDKNTKKRKSSKLNVETDTTIVEERIVVREVSSDNGEFQLKKYLGVVEQFYETALKQAKGMNELTTTVNGLINRLNQHEDTLQKILVNQNTIIVDMAKYTTESVKKADDENEKCKRCFVKDMKLAVTILSIILGGMLVSYGLINIEKIPFVSNIIGNWIVK